MSRSTHRVVTVEMMAERILVTGSSGFIGAWVVRDLIERRVPFVMLDRDPNLRRLGDLLPELPSGLKVITGDVSDLDVVARAIEENGVTAIIHLAGAQIPICRETPLLGAQINVMGTMAVFEAARQQGTIRQIAYASSAGVMGRVEDYPPGLIPSDAPARPATHYGVFKQCNEGNARVYFQDHGVSSVGLRPGTVYGVGRDFGLTSDPTKAVKAALVGRLRSASGETTPSSTPPTWRRHLSSARWRSAKRRSRSICGAEWRRSPSSSPSLSDLAP